MVLASMAGSGLPWGLWQLSQLTTPWFSRCRSAAWKVAITSRWQLKQSPGEAAVMSPVVTGVWWMVWHDVQATPAATCWEEVPMVCPVVPA